MLSVNRATIVGNVGTDLDVKYTQSGTAVVNFRVATNNRYKKDGELVENTEWHTIVAWADLAETAASLLHKGSRVMVEGPIKHRTYEDRDGVERRTTEIKATFINAFDSATYRTEDKEEGEYDENVDKKVDEDVDEEVEADDDEFGPDDDLPF